MNEKKVNKLFDILGTQLAKHKPKDPNEFLLSELQRIADLKADGQPVSRKLYFYQKSASCITLSCVIMFRCRCSKSAT
jgi:hypothetical protein